MSVLQTQAGTQSTLAQAGGGGAAAAEVLWAAASFHTSQAQPANTGAQTAIIVARPPRFK